MLGWILFGITLWILAGVLVMFTHAAGIGKRRETWFEKLLMLPLAIVFGIYEIIQNIRK